MWGGGRKKKARLARGHCVDLEPLDLPAYDSGASEEGGVGSRIGLEKNLGDYSDGLFADRRRQPASGSDQVREVENNFVNAFSQEKNFIAGLIGIGFLALFYVSVYNSNGGTMDAPRYGAVPPGKGKVIERYEEAFVCYGVPTAGKSSRRRQTQADRDRERGLHIGC